MVKHLLLFPVAVMMFTAVLYQTMAISGSVSIFNDTVTVSNETDWVSNWTEGGESTTMEMEGYEMTAGFDARTGALVWLIGLVALGAVAGITVLGSGLKEFSIKLIVKVVGYYAFWFLISVFAMDAFGFMPFAMGWILYLVITVIFSFGVLEQV